MADGMREKTTNVGGVIKRIWYAMTGATQGAQLLSLDDAGNLEGKLLNPVINGTATGTGVTVTGEANKLLKTDSSGRLNLTTNEIIRVKPTTILGLVAGTWYNVCESSIQQPDDTIMVNLACYISSGNNHSALIAISKTSGFYKSATTLASSSSGLVPTYTFRISAGYLQISFNATNLPASFNVHTIARFS
jgi:hypothetical protein